MTVGTPVVVSRIQNRRGTQQQFDGYAYSISGPNSVYPAGYNGIAGFGNDPAHSEFTQQNYPNVLLPGELALCTDSRRLFMGNVNGTFSEIFIGLQDTDLSRIRPQPFILAPTDTISPGTYPYWVKIDGLTINQTIAGPINQTPFLNFFYSVTDSLLPTTTGTTFSRNGELQITALASPTITLTDSSTEINTTPYDISFQVAYENDALSGNDYITVWYTHDFPSNLVFATTAMTWLPLTP